MQSLESDKHTEELAQTIRVYMRYRDWFHFTTGFVSGTMLTYYLMKK
jgi:hypothetical protein